MHDTKTHVVPIPSVGAKGRRQRVGVIELIAFTVASEWARLIGVPRFKRQLYGIMPQVVSVWCRELGHDVTYATYYGQADPVTLLPDDLDVVFISRSIAHRIWPWCCGTTTPYSITIS